MRHAFAAHHLHSAFWIKKTDDEDCVKQRKVCSAMDLSEPSDIPMCWTVGTLVGNATRR
jgi:hypothetical protein